MVEADRLALVAGLQLLEVLDRLVRDVLPRPGGGDRGVHRELLDVELAEHDEIVVADQAQVGGLAGERHALVGLRPVADKVAEAPELVDALRLDVGEHGLVRGQVSVDVGEDCDPKWRYRNAL